MVIKIKDFGVEQQIKIIKRYSKYFNKEKGIWELPSIEMKNIISECWSLSKILNKHKHEIKASEKLVRIEQILKE